MSRGPGRVERAIEAALDAEPDNAFTTEDLCARAYPDAPRLGKKYYAYNVYPDAAKIEKKHRVAVLRAMGKVAARRGLWLMFGSGIGSPMIIYDRRNVLSLAIAVRGKGYDCGPRYQSKRSDRNQTEAEIRARFAPGGKDHAMVLEGADYWFWAEIAKAEDDGDAVRVQALKDQINQRDEANEARWAEESRVWQAVSASAYQLAEMLK